MEIPAPFPDNGFKEETNLPTDVNLVTRFDVICRFCLVEKKRLMDIFQLSDHAVATVESLVDIKIEPEDMLPKQICASCHELVNQCLAFKQQVASTDTALRRCTDQLKQVEIATKVEDVENYAPRMHEQRIFDANPAFNELNEGHKFEELIEEEDCTIRDELDCVKDANLYSEYIEKLMEDGANAVIDSPECKSEPINTRSRTSLNCEQCNKTFSCSSHLQRHIKSHATIRTNSQSRRCTNGHIPSHTILNENTKEQIKAFKLTKSNASSAVEYVLSIHELLHPEDDKIQCGRCDKNFSKLEQLRRHVKTHCNNKARGLKKTIRKHSKEKLFKCSHCTKLFGSSSALAIHLRRHTSVKPYQCPHCSKSFSTSWSLKRHVRTHTVEKPYQCPHCTKSFRLSSTFTCHVRTHTGEKPYQCPHCTKSFRLSSTFTCHVRTHTGEKPYKCPHCTKSFRKSCTLYKHMNTHSDEKPYKCPHCSKSFAQNPSLVDHVRTHTGEKPFKCSHCSKSYFRSSALADHVRLHTGEEPYKCPHCPKSCNRPSKLVEHIRTHTGEKPLKCPQCPVLFAHSSALATHIKRHKGEKPHKCPHCSKAFITTSKLAIHVRTHTSEKSYKRSHCSKELRTSTSLADHVSIHTGKK